MNWLIWVVFALALVYFLLKIIDLVIHRKKKDKKGVDPNVPHNGDSH